MLRAFLPLWLCVVLLASGCALTPPPLQVKADPRLTPLPAGEPLYFVPFLTVMTPPAIGKSVFDRIVDRFNDTTGKGGPEGVILKQGEGSDKAWLAARPHVEGVIFGYLRESGCCSTDLRLKVRARLHQPGIAEPTLQIDVARSFFFDHDRATVEGEEARLIEELSAELVQALRHAVTPP